MRPNTHNRVYAIYSDQCSTGRNFKNSLFFIEWGKMVITKIKMKKLGIQDKLLINILYKLNEHCLRERGYWERRKTPYLIKDLNKFFIHKFAQLDYNSLFPIQILA